MTRRPAAILAALTLAAGVAGCTPTADPAVTAALAYYKSWDAGTPEHCSLRWSDRLDAAEIAECESTATAVNAITSTEVKKVITMPAPAGAASGKALVLSQSMSRGGSLKAVAMAQDASGKWFWVKDQTIAREPLNDDELIGALA